MTKDSKTIGAPQGSTLRAPLKIGGTKGGKKAKKIPEPFWESDVEEDLDFEKNKGIGQVIDETPKKHVTFAEENLRQSV